MDPIAICALFTTAPQSCWVGGTPHMIGDDPKKMYVAIQEDDDYWLNKCILRNWYFNYDECKKLGLEMDCADYGVYVFWKK
jgi:hypothetical protein